MTHICGKRGGGLPSAIAATAISIAGLTCGVALASEATAVACDTTKAEDVERAFASADAAGGALAVVVYNAGNAAFGDLLDMDPEYFEAVWRVTCLGGFLVGQQAGRRMVEQEKGTLIFTGARPPVGRKR